jgi:hypothetical protein
MIVAKLSHGGVAVYDTSNNRLLQWMMISSGTAMSAQVRGDEVEVTFSDAGRGIYDRGTGQLKRMVRISP